MFTSLSQVYINWSTSIDNNCSVLVSFIIRTIFCKTKQVVYIRDHWVIDFKVSFSKYYVMLVYFLLEQPVFNKYKDKS